MTAKDDFENCEKKTADEDKKRGEKYSTGNTGIQKILRTRRRIIEELF